MDKVVKDILSALKGEKEVDKITKINNKYLITLSDNGEPIVDVSYIFENGKIAPFSPVGHFKELNKVTKTVVYDRRKRK